MWTRRELLARSAAAVALLATSRRAWGQQPLGTVLDATGPFLGTHFHPARALDTLRALSDLDPPGAFGFDARLGEFADLWKAGIVDPTKVTRWALQNAASVASMLLTSRAVIVELKEKKKAVAGAVK
jgi:hypothetical protein